MVFEDYARDDSLTEINELQTAIKEAFLPRGEFSKNIIVDDEVFLPEDAKFRAKVFMAEDRNLLLQESDVSRNPDFETIEDVAFFHEKNNRLSEEDGFSVDVIKKFHSSLDDVPQEAFLPEFENPLADAELAKEVFFPKEDSELLDANPFFDEEIFFHRHPNFKNLFDDVRSSLESGRIIHAKKLYNQLRSILNSENFKTVESVFVKKKMLSLYEDIRLKHLEAEAIKRLER